MDADADPLYVQLDQPGRLKHVRDGVRARLAKLGVDQHRADDVVIAVNEAVANAAVHGYRSDPGPVEVDVQTENADLHVRVRDYGQGRPNPAAGERGLGFSIMRQVAADVTFEQWPGQGSEVRMRFPLR